MRPTGEDLEDLINSINQLPKFNQLQKRLILIYELNGLSRIEDLIAQLIHDMKLLRLQQA